MTRPVPTRIRTDIVARWLIGRAESTVEEVMARMVPIEASDVQFTVRGDAPKPIFDITTHGDGPATLVSGGDWLDRGGNLEILATQITDQELARPRIRLFADLPETMRLSAVGRPLSDVVDCTAITGLSHVRVTAVGVSAEDDMLEISLEPEWITHDI